MLKRSLIGIRVSRAALGASWAALAVLALPTPAQAGDISFKLEPGLAVPLSAPQSRVYDVGGGQTLKLLFGLTPYLDIGPSASFLLLPAAETNAESGIAWGLGGGVRIKRPWDGKKFYGISPWFDIDALYIRTGALNRPGFDAAVGLAVPVGASRNLWIGPYVRYLQTFQPTHAGYDNRDAKILILGVSFEVGSGIARSSAETAVATHEVIVTKEVAVCPDRDQDGLPDNVDHCPEVAGGIDDWGCPKYDKVVVARDKLELREKVYFAWDQAKIEEASFPVLDQVVQALKDNKGFQVQVEGHADSSGADDHNQTLSEKRAEAVVDYIAAHGVPRERIASKGFSSSIPTDNNGTVAGRENNRRVEFVVRFNILNPGSSK
jgi:outer membrane protein OmpA-like peptidoglycan-associated protein